MKKKAKKKDVPQVVLPIPRYCERCGGMVHYIDSIFVKGDPIFEEHVGAPHRCIVHLRQKIEDLDALLARCTARSRSRP